MPIRQLQQHIPQPLQNSFKGFAQKMGWVKRVSYFQVADDYPIAVIIQSVLTQQLLNQPEAPLDVTDSAILSSANTMNDDELSLLFSSNQTDDFAPVRQSPLEMMKKVLLVEPAAPTAVKPELPVSTPVLPKPAASMVKALNTVKTSSLAELLPVPLVRVVAYSIPEALEPESIETPEESLSTLRMLYAAEPYPVGQSKMLPYKAAITVKAEPVAHQVLVVPVYTKTSAALGSIKIMPYTAVNTTPATAAVAQSTHVGVAKQLSVLPMVSKSHSILSAAPANSPEIIKLLQQVTQPAPVELPQEKPEKIEKLNNLLPLIPAQPSKPIDAIEMISVLPTADDEFFSPLESKLYNPKPELAKIHRQEQSMPAITFDIGLDEDNDEDWFAELPLPVPSRKKIANHLTTLQTDANFEGLGFKISYNIGHVGPHQLLLVQQGEQLSLLADNGFEGRFLKHFDENPMPKGAAKIVVSQVSRLGRRQLLTVQIGTWQGVVCVDDVGSISLQTEVALI